MDNKNNKLPTLPLEEIKTKFPKSYRELCSFLKDVSGGMEGKDLEEYTDIILVHASRMALPDFFDEYKLYISVVNNGGESEWYFDVVGTTYPEDFVAYSRREAEEKVYMFAFQELENKLNQE